MIERDGDHEREPSMVAVLDPGPLQDLPEGETDPVMDRVGFRAGPLRGVRGRDLQERGKDRDRFRPALPSRALHAAVLPW